MNGGVLPMLLIGAALGLALTASETRVQSIAAALYAIVAAGASFLPLSENLAAPIFAGVMLSTIATAAIVFLPASVPDRVAIGFAANAGAWLGAASMIADRRVSLLLAIPVVLIAIPGKLLARQQHGIAIKVLASWLIAIASLALFVSLVPTPGYEPDHME